MSLIPIPMSLPKVIFVVTQDDGPEPVIAGIHRTPEKAWDQVETGQGALSVHRVSVSDFLASDPDPEVKQALLHIEARQWGQCKGPTLHDTMDP